LVESDPTAEYIVTLLSTTDLPNQPSLKARGLAWRLLSASEVLLGAAIVIGHNVFRVVPNEVPILFVLGLVSVRVRDGGWSAIGFKRPESWLRLTLIALAAAVLRIVLGDFVIEPLAAHWWPPIQAPAGTEHIAGNIKMALLWLLIIWTFAAFGEEISYRGYLTLRAADVGGDLRGFLAGNTLGVVLFSYGHYKGPTGFSIRAWPVSFSGGVFANRAKPLGPGVDARIYRYRRSDRRIFRMGRVRRGARLPRRELDIAICNIKYLKGAEERSGVEEDAADDRGYNAKRRPIAQEIWRGKRLSVIRKP
jgi:membrane protease YdiL (CAAX protease family)